MTREDIAQLAKDELAAFKQKEEAMRLESLGLKPKIDRRALAKQELDDVEKARLLERGTAETHDSKTIDRVSGLGAATAARHAGHEETARLEALQRQVTLSQGYRADEAAPSQMSGQGMQGERISARGGSDSDSDSEDEERKVRKAAKKAKKKAKKAAKKEKKKARKEAKRERVKKEDEGRSSRRGDERDRSDRSSKDDRDRRSSRDSRDDRGGSSRGDSRDERRGRSRSRSRSPEQGRRRRSRSRSRS